MKQDKLLIEQMNITHATLSVTSEFNADEQITYALDAAFCMTLTNQDKTISIENVTVLYDWRDVFKHTCLDDQHAKIWGYLLAYKDIEDYRFNRDVYDALLKKEMGIPDEMAFAFYNTVKDALKEPDYYFRLKVREFARPFFETLMKSVSQ